MIPEEKELLHEYFFAADHLYQAHDGDGILLSKEENFLAIVNVREHLQLHYLKLDHTLEEGWERIEELEEGLSSVREAQSFARTALNIEHFVEDNKANRDANIYAASITSAFSRRSQVLRVHKRV